MNLIHSSRIPLGFPTLQPLPALVNGTMLQPDVKQMILNQTYTVIDEPCHKSCLYVSREYAGRTEYYIIAPAEPDTKMAPGMALADLCCVTVSPLEALILGSGYGCAAYTYLGRIRKVEDAGLVCADPTASELWKTPDCDTRVMLTCCGYSVLSSCGTAVLLYHRHRGCNELRVSAENGSFCLMSHPRGCVPSMSSYPWSYDVTAEQAKQLLHPDALLDFYRRVSNSYN